MTPQNFIENRIKVRRVYDLTPKDKRKIAQNFEQFILERITSGKYKKSKIDLTTLEKLKVKIHNAVSSNLPLQFTFPFGGYKLYKSPSYPTVDWAEFFTIAYYSDYLNQIAEYYKPGVIFTFSSDEVIINKMDNIPQEDINSYSQSFLKLLDLFNESNPKNIRFELKFVRDLYESLDALWEEVESYYPETKNNWDGFDSKKKDERKKMILLNYKFMSNKNPDNMSDQELEELLKDNVQLHDSYLKLTKRRAFVRGSDKIVVFSLPINDSITIGTTKYSAAKFWTGYGALKLDLKQNFCDEVLTPEQLKDKSYKEVKIDLIDLPNLHTVRIYE